MIIVTGGTGFIGSNIVAALDAKKEHRIVICDRLGDKDKWRNIAKHGLDNIVAPENLITFLEENHKQIKLIFHMGAISSTTETNVDEIIKNNYSLSLTLWNWCAQNRTRFIYASSAATYGNGSAGFIDGVENLDSYHPLNPYGWSKHLFDKRVAKSLEEKESVPPQWVGLKFFNVYGPNEYHKGAQQSVISHIFRKAVKGESFNLFKSHNPNYPDGAQSRDFIYIDDCIDIMMYFMENYKLNGLFNAGSGKTRSFLDLAKATYQACNQPVKIGYVDIPESMRDKYQYYTEASLDKLRAVGYDKPFTSLEVGINTYVKSYLLTNDPYK